jgi:Acetyl-coenzyme A synthetase N-terminus
VRRGISSLRQGFVEQANAADPAIFERFSEEHFPDCFKEYADLLTWDAPWHTTLDTSNAPFWKWFTGGKLNASLPPGMILEELPIRAQTFEQIFACKTGARPGEVSDLQGAHPDPSE